MARNTYGQYTATSLTPVGRGETTPGVELCESVVPWIGSRALPAPWLPIKRWDEHAKSGVVISVGVAVGYDINGYLVPAGMVGGTTTVTYTSYDVDMGVINVADGEPVETGDIGSVTVPSGLLGGTSGVIPVGFASYNYYQHLGGFTATGTYASDYGYTVDNDNPIKYRLHNTSKEDLVAFTCDYVIEVPWIGATENAIASLTTKALSYAHAYGTFSYGGFVKVDAKGMYIPSTTNYDNLFVGQVLGYRTYPADALNRVKTAYEGATNTSWSMPGSATGGVPRAIHLATDGAYYGGDTTSRACTSIIINFQK